MKHLVEIWNCNIVFDCNNVAFILPGTHEIHSFNLVCRR